MDVSLNYHIYLIITKIRNIIDHYIFSSVRLNKYSFSTCSRSSITSHVSYYKHLKVRGKNLVRRVFGVWTCFFIGLTHHYHPPPIPIATTTTLLLLTSIPTHCPPALSPSSDYPLLPSYSQAHPLITLHPTTTIFSNSSGYILDVNTTLTHC